uniref:Uncharacterized protein n=1 Tax=Trichinella nativa TaxID=6335 RepID=A0A0V1KJZ1_9BILA
MRTLPSCFYDDWEEFTLPRPLNLNLPNAVPP